MQGQIAMYVDGFFHRRTFDSAGFGQYGIGPLPKGIGQDTPSTILWGDFYTIAADSRNKEAAWRVLRSLLIYRWRLEDDVPTYGVEGGSRLLEASMSEERHREYMQLITKFTLPYGNLVKVAWGCFLWQSTT